MLQLTMRIFFEALAIDELDLQAVSQSALDATLEKGYQPVPGSLKFVFTSEPVLDETDHSTVRGELRIERLIEGVMVEKEAVDAVRGKTISDAQQILKSSLALEDAPEIKMYPVWWARLPFLPFRISVVKQ